jgi:hypothetical protein
VEDSEEGKDAEAGGLNEVLVLQTTKHTLAKNVVWKLL